MTGPEEEITSLDKHDGPHWELFDCPGREAVTEDDQVIVKAGCTDDSNDSNCDTVFRGGVPRTVVEMPSTCSIGRYAMAVIMEPSQNQSLPPHVLHKLVTRGVNFQRAPRIFDFTFDYDFSVLHGFDFASHHVKDTFPFWFFNEHLPCSFYGTSAQLTLIRRLNDLTSWEQSHVLFRNKGSVQAGRHMAAQVTLRFSTGQLEIFGM
ncbi:hypothetical protein PT974_03489 [Cladobotryum mycophilum]|uniref:Uncharacterized protein n=1 Tax=Cladobotryum mycophilum TaxID=491253 RepID=A0ABR0SSF7_9HYPO